MSNEINIEELERIAKDLIHSAPWTALYKDLTIVFDVTMTPENVLSLINRLKKAEAELENERMRLAACGVVALADTPESAAKAREMRDEYRSASCEDVARRVDECMTLRAERDAMARDAERYRWIRGGSRIGVKWCELYSGGAALDEAIDSTMKALPSVTAKARFNRVGGHDETDPIERLRFFCSIAMSRQQDWLDVEPFFNDVIAERDALAAKLKDAEHDRDEFRRVMNGFAEKMAELEGQEPVAWMTANREMTSFVNFHDDDLPLYARPVPAEEGIVTVTTNDAGRCVMVSRQDEDHRILSVIWEAKDVPTEPVNARLLSALIQCRDRFAFYVGHHLDKGDMGKAAENEKFVALANEAISAAEAQQERLLQDMHVADLHGDSKAVWLTNEEVSKIVTSKTWEHEGYIYGISDAMRAIEAAFAAKNGIEVAE